MTQRALSIGMATVILLASGTRAWACYNDSNSEAAEREFRSRYDRPVPVSRAGQTNSSAVATACVGSLLNVMAIGLLLRRRKATGDAAKVGSGRHMETRS